MENENTKIDHKFSLVQEILENGAYRRNLIAVNLNGAKLIEANLINAILIRADLSSANLRDADLRGAILINADLHSANLINTNLINADLVNARFANNPGISLEVKLDLIQRGAIFEDSPGEHSGVLVPR